MGISITVVIPAYNREKTIERAIRSVYGQTFLPMEVIVVDDASSDQTVDIVRHLQTEFDTLKLHTLIENRGAQNARNTGVIDANGEWIEFLDSDDEWTPNALEILADAIKKNPGCSAVFGDGYIVWGNARQYRTCADKNKKVYDLRDVLGAEILFSCMIVRKKVLEDIGLLDSKVPAYHEMDTRLRIAQKYRFIYVPKPIFLYHMHSGETISKNKKRNADGYRYVILKNHKLINSVADADVVEMYYDGIYRRCVSKLEKYFYHGMLSVYHLTEKNPCVRNVLICLMKLEFKVRY